MEASLDDALIAVTTRYWGYSELRPLQREAMHATVAGRDSVVVLPTGGGKSLCYQAPALVIEGLTVVVSPLISLMKDQVDGLTANGIVARQMNSSQSPMTQREVEQDLLAGKVKILFLSPERLAMQSCRQLLRKAGVRTFAIDEAHCISHWGHDFRPEYRQLAQLHDLFPDASIHAYTATATERVRVDIARQLALRDPLELVGSFDRPNLTYRVIPRRAQIPQIEEVIARHPKEAGIIYCIRRKDVDEVSVVLTQRGHKVVAYHAGLSPDERREAQEAFASEECDIVVATVAFGMGIDRSNVRFVMHTGMPKSIEHYQQETGRAGRDGLEAECVLLFSPSDAIMWRTIMEGSAGEDADEEFLRNAFRSLDQMQRYCGGGVCRHRALVEHFGQNYPADNCGSCDVCLGDFVPVDDATTIARKILSCVVRLRDSFGASYLASVLRGEGLARIRERNHDSLSTYGILSKHPAVEIREWIGQLVAQGLLHQDSGPFPLLSLTKAGREVLLGGVEARLVRARQEEPAAKRGEASWEGVDRGLFESLREWRRATAEAKGMQPFIVFNDATLRQLAAIRPSTLTRMRAIYGVGDTKLADFGREVLQVIDNYCERVSIARDVDVVSRPVARAKSTGPVSAVQVSARVAYRNGASIAEVSELTGRAMSTAALYLAEYVLDERPPSIDHWVPADRQEVIARAAAQCGLEKLKPIKELLGDSFSYDEIRLVVNFLSARQGLTGN